MGHEQTGRRLGVIVQADELLGLSTVLVAPTSTRVPTRDFRAEVLIDGEATRVMAEQIHSVDVQFLGPRVTTLSHDELQRVNIALKSALDLFGLGTL